MTTCSSTLPSSSSATSIASLDLVEPDQAASQQMCDIGADMPVLRPWSRSWPLDKTGRFTFLKIPDTVNLSNRLTQEGLYGGQAGITELPAEIQWEILSQLPVVDRVCLSITCKKMADLARNSPHLVAAPWTPWLLYTNDYFPSRYLLIQRLAHGWFDKKQWRYCWYCQKIMPRDADFFRKKLQKRKKPRWDMKVDMPQAQWRRASKKKRYEHLISTWCEEKREDSSFMSCAPCTNEHYTSGTLDYAADVEKYARGEKEHSPIYKRYPVECPLCLEKTLTYVYKPPRKKRIRPFLLRAGGLILSISGNSMLVLCYLLYLLIFKAPWDLGNYFWRKYKERRSRPFGLNA